MKIVKKINLKEKKKKQYKLHSQIQKDKKEKLQLNQDFLNSVLEKILSLKQF